MICDNCKIDKLVNDFINNSNICYKCVYQKKLEKCAKNRTSKKLICRNCGNDIVLIKDARKRQRTVFCCKKCAVIGHRELARNYWCRKIQTLNVIVTSKKIRNEP